MVKNIAVSGDEGSFSEEAALRYAKKKGFDANLIYLIDMENVLTAVENGKTKLGIFPVINLQGGLVRMAFDAMGRHNFKVIDELWLHIYQCLIVKPGITRHKIKKIVSHPQALAQCKQYLEKKFPIAKLIEWDDTAKAARDLAADKLDESHAVIAPARAASIYELKILAKNIQDKKDNLTAFLIVKKLLGYHHGNYH